MDEEAYQRIRDSIRSANRYYPHSTQKGNTTILHRTIEVLFLMIAIGGLISLFFVYYEFAIFSVGVSLTSIFALIEHNIQKGYGYYDENGNKELSLYSVKEVLIVVLAGIVSTILVFTIVYMTY